MILMLEKTIQASIIKWLRSKGIYTVKIQSGYYGKAGVPDILVCYKGHFLGFEVKRLGNKATELQKNNIKQIISSGGQAFVVYSLEEVKKVINSVQL